ncbi:hypothetical protein [Roseomonas populi]|uniref:DUF4169 family protein n=1 Tax=Roseomonas populi TaxID=3121582 RepID=A0ABT1X2R3_9PROT|nr:hypothetical protein [Roseomonas pecuniae]MCR0981467.1 hypothetical protein [Roseomonas pecuniae]
MKKPNYNQDRMQRERNKAAKAQAKEQKKLDQKEAKLSLRPESESVERENGGRD